MDQKNRAKSEIDLKKYEDLDGLSLREMNFGLWLSLHRRRIFKLVVIFLIIACAAMFIYSTYNYLFYFLYGRQADQDLTNGLTTEQIGSQAYTEANTPQNLNIGTVSIFSVKGKYDFLVPLKNLNPKHSGTFNYCFQDSAGNNFVCGDSFILPGAEKYLVLAGKELDSAPVSAKLVITKIFWQRLNAHTIPDWQSYSGPRLDLPVSAVKYSAADTSAKTSFHTLTFKIKNNTPYNYARVPLDIVLFNGSLPTGVNSYNVDNLLSSESREINLSWPSAGERVSNVEVKPDLNILDNQVYLPYTGKTVSSTSNVN